MTPVTIGLENHTLGDIWSGILSIGPITINGVTPAETLAKVRMWLRHTDGTLFKISSDGTETPDGVVTIDNATTWEAHVPEIADFVTKAGVWSWDMEFWRTGAIGPETLFKGRLTVTDDITKPA